MEVASSSDSASASQNRKRKQVVPDKAIDDEGDGKIAGGHIIINDFASGYNNQQTMESIAIHEVQEKGTSSNDVASSSTNCVENDMSYDYMDYEYSDDENNDCYSEVDNEEFEYDEEDIENDCNYNVAARFEDLDLPPGVEAVVPWLQVHEKPSDTEKNVAVEDEIDMKFKSFKQFDVVEDYSDHYFKDPKGFSLKKPSKEWTKRIQHEWKLLEQHLPGNMILVRVYEDRMDLLRAVIIGPVGTPYHDGLFFFDFHFPTDYPNSPPKGHYHSGGLRLNPNLYNCGKICLSLLNTWSGKGCELWDSSKSTMLQVLISIQALILNEKPYFNEPGFERTANTQTGEKRALSYNEDTFVLSCKTMLYTLRKPPKHFEDFVAGHFRQRGQTILRACKAYLAGLKVGSTVEEGQSLEEAADISKFKDSLKKLFEDLLMEFTVKGADCDAFLAQKVKAGAARAKLMISDQ